MTANATLNQPVGDPQNLGVQTPVQGFTNPTNTFTAPDQQPRYFTAEDLERARQQEKDKLYERMQRSEQQLNEFRKTVEELAAEKRARDDELAKQRADAEKEAKRLQDEKLTVQQLLEKQQQEFQAQQAKLQTDWDAKLAAMQMEAKYQQLKAFIQRRINEEVNATTIIPDLAEYITGDTEEEVEASIQKAKDKTAAIVQAALGSSPPTSIPMGTSPTGAPFSPLDNLSPANRQLTRDQIAAMSMKDYAEYRRQQGYDKAGTGRGLFS